MGKSRWQPIGKFALLSLLLVLMPAPATSVERATVSTELEQYLLSKPGSYSVTALEIAGGDREVHLHDHTQVDPASIFKLYYAGLAFEKIQNGKWSLSTKLTSNYSVQTCLKMMISFSDNECAVDLRQKLGIKFINSRLLTFGLADSHVVTNSEGEYLTKHTTTADVAKFLSLLQSGELLDSTQTTRFRNLLKGQVWRARISSALPVGTVVGSKSGQLLTNTGMIEGDSAIVFGPKSTYILVVIGRSGSTGAAVRGVSDFIYRQWQGQITKASNYPPSQLTTLVSTFLRTRPGGPIIRTLAPGTSLTLEWSERGWLMVRVGSRKGYVYQNTVRLSNRYLNWGSP
jgi:beta-lactamase class A